MAQEMTTKREQVVEAKEAEEADKSKKSVKWEQCQTCLNIAEREIFR